MNPQNTVLKILIPVSFVGYLALNVISWKFPFFWDTILTSTICSWFYENGLNGLIYPTKLDAGHPPLFYLYLLSWWHMMEPSLLVSHFAMLPILWAMAYQTFRVGDLFIQDKTALAIFCILFLLEPSILTQSTMVSYDIAMLALFMIALRYMYIQRTLWQILAMCFLTFISIRGSIAVVSLFFIELSLKQILWNEKKPTWMLKYLFCAILVLTWHAYHYKETGWLLSTPSTYWENHRSIATIPEVLRNMAVIIRNMADHGRLAFLLLLIPGIVILIVKNRHKTTDKLIELLAIFFIPLEVFTIFFIFFTNPIGHRYFMIPIACGLLLLAYCFQELKWMKKLAFLPMLAFMLGHFLIYPPPISNGWDVSLAHTRYFKLYKELHQYMSKEVIAVRQVASKFPISASRKQTHLGKNDVKMEYFQLDSLGYDFKYVVYSNISNDFTDDEIEELAGWEILKRFQSGPVFIELLAVPEKSESEYLE